jgi:hypothetical protein
MAKFYVQSGSRKMVMNAADPQAAGLWLVHCALSNILPAYDDPNMSVEDRCEIALVQGLMNLDNEVLVSERGFDRMDAVQFSVFELINEWHALMTALLRFEAEQG